MPPAPVIDPRLPISELAQAAVLHAPLQVWVHVGLNGYRRAYARAFPTEDISGKVLSHAMNRRSADLRGYQYVRITVASRRANSSSAFSEQWGVALYQRTAADKEKARRGAFIEYASLAELMVMMDMSVGGGVMGLVNDAQHLVKPRP